MFLAHWMLHKIKLLTPSEVWISTWKWFPTDSCLLPNLWSASDTTVDHVNLIACVSNHWFESCSSMFSGNFMEHLWLMEFQMGKSIENLIQDILNQHTCCGYDINRLNGSGNLKFDQTRTNQSKWLNITSIGFLPNHKVKKCLGCLVLASVQNQNPMQGPSFSTQTLQMPNEVAQGHSGHSVGGMVRRGQWIGQQMSAVAQYESTSMIDPSWSDECSLSFPSNAK